MIIITDHILRLVFQFSTSRAAEILRIKFSSLLLDFSLNFGLLNLRCGALDRSFLVCDLLLKRLEASLSRQKDPRGV